VRILYRSRQFWQALSASPAPEELALTRTYLSPSLLAIFNQMSPSEQTHSLSIARQLIEQGETHPDLLAAALLHDSGKSRHPLRIWERVLIVVGKALFPTQTKRWGQDQPKGWKKAFVVAEQHSEWGAQMAANAGASPLTVALIRHHQSPLERAAASLEDRLLLCLQELDNES
jgi:HD domain